MRALHRTALFLLLMLPALAGQAAEIFVNLESDESGSLGTLRDALNNRASPGDTIVIQTERIWLTDALVIRTAGLTIQGNGVVIAPLTDPDLPLSIEASGVTLNDLNLVDIRVIAGSPQPEAQISNFTMTASHLRGESRLHIGLVNDCLVQGNTVVNQGNSETAISLLFTERCVIRNNIIRSDTNAIVDLESEELTIDDNRISGGGWLYSSTNSGSITNNRIRLNNDRSGIYIDHSVPDDRLLVTGNHAPWMVVYRSNVEISGNHLTLREGSTRLIALRVRNSSPGGARGSVVIHDNTIRGGQIGMTYQGLGDTAGPAWITSNKIRGCTDRGMMIRQAENLQITDNRIRYCGGTGERSAGMELAGPIYENVLVSRNNIHHITGPGMLVRPGLESGGLLIELNRVHENTSDGIRVRRDSLLAQTEAPQIPVEPPPDVDVGAIVGEVQTEDAATDGQFDLTETLNEGGPSEPIIFDRNRIFANSGYGVYAEPGSRARISRGHVTANQDAGVFVDVEARVQISRVRFENNIGPGIDIVPAGVSTNDSVKFANNDLDWPEALQLSPVTRKLLGQSLPNARIEVFRVESEPRAGNPENGEGVDFLGSTIADSAGRFVFPDNGELVCEEGSALTLTAIVGDQFAWTSEFSTDLPCVFPDPDLTDTDGDGVEDNLDNCPDTPAGTVVDESGCEVGGPTNTAPVANAGSAQNLVVGEPVVLDGSASSDPDGDILVFVWLVPEAPVGSTAILTDANTPTPGFTPDVAGTYRILLTVSDGELSDSISIEIVAEEPNQPPLIAARVDGQVGVGSAVTLDASSSSDPDGDVLIFFWYVSDAPAGSTAVIGAADEAIANFSPDLPGPYTLQLRLSDGIDEVFLDLPVLAGASESTSFAEILCFDESDCDIQEGGSTGSCVNCTARFNDGSRLNCSGAEGGFTIVAEGELSGMNCSSFEAPGMSANCTGSLCGHVNGGGYRCDGPPGGCQVYSAEDELLHECGNLPCATFVSTSAVQDDSDIPAPSEVVVRKQSVDGDGTFTFDVENLGWTINAQSSWTVVTENGVGDKEAYVLSKDEGEFHITERVDPLWTVSSRCVDSNGNVSLSNRQVAAGSDSPLGVSLDCEFTNNAQPDDDGDGWPNDIDPCSNPGTNGLACPRDEDNGFVHLYCNDASGCYLDELTGGCTNCLAQRLDGSASISCAAGESCTVLGGNALQCSGSCAITTPGVEGQCEESALCTVDEGLTCESPGEESGCSGTFTSDGRELGCEGPEPCDIRVSPTVVSSNNTPPAYLDVHKRTEGGDGMFDFIFTLTFPSVTAEITVDSGAFSIATQSGIGLSSYRIYFAPTLNRTIVHEAEVPPFLLTAVECDLPDQVRIASDLSIADVGNINACTFVNVRQDAQPAQVRILPDGATGPEEANNIATTAFGLPPGNRVAVGTDQGTLIIDVDTGSVPFAGNARLSFLDNAIASIGGVVQENAVFPEADLMLSYGYPSASYYFDPAQGTMSYAVLVGGNTTDVVHLGGDVDSPILLKSENTSNIVRASIPHTQNATGFTNRDVIESINLLGKSGSVVSAFSHNLGRLDCYNPCQDGGAPMPAQCNADIDEVIETAPGCGDSWTAGCRNLFNTQSGGFCSQPTAQRQMNFGGMVMLVTDGQPGQVHLADPALDYYGRATTLGTVGDAPRRVRCLGTICIVTSYGSDIVTVLTWDGLLNAAITATVPVGDGPVGTSLKEIDGNVVALTTGSLDDTYNVITIAADGSVVANVSHPIPEGCANPSFILWVNGSSSALATCGGSDSYALFEPEM